MTHLFISREVDGSGPLATYVRERGGRLTAFSLIDFQPVRFAHLPAADWVFFSSPKGVQFFFRLMEEAGIAPASGIRIAVLGDGTARALKPFGKSPDFSGNGAPEEVAAAFGILAAGSRVLFPQAQHSRRSVQRQVADQLTVLDLVVYANVPKTDFQITPPPEIILLTSPLNARAYLDRYPWQSGQKAIAIGPTTGAYLRKAGIDLVYEARTPSEQGMLEVLQEVW